MVEALSRGWQPAPVPAVGLTVLAVAYLVAARRVDRGCPTQPWPRARTACFLTGVLAVAVAVLGPPGYFDDTFFFAHMTQHIVLTLVAAPLLVLGDPVLLALRTSSGPFRRRWLVPALRGRLLRRMTHPVLGWLVFTAVVVGSHVPAVYDYPLSHPAVHDLVEHPLYLASALLFFYPLLAPTPGPRRVPASIRVLSLLTIMVPASFAGFFIYVAPQVAYPFYARVARPFGPGALADQHLAGALMWSSSMVLSVAWLCLAGAFWLREDAVRTRRIDRALDKPHPAAPGWST